jgi:hypothetical protein
VGHCDAGLCLLTDDDSWCESYRRQCTCFASSPIHDRQTLCPISHIMHNVRVCVHLWRYHCTSSQSILTSTRVFVYTSLRMPLVSVLSKASFEKLRHPDSSAKNDNVIERNLLLDAQTTAGRHHPHFKSRTSSNILNAFTGVTTIKYPCQMLQSE